MTYYAHSGTPGDTSDWQTIVDHVRGVVRRAEASAAIVGLEKAAAVMAAAHDHGKYHPDFQKRLHGSKLSVDHSTAGAAIILQRAKDPANGPMAELIAYGILGHHAGLPDRQSPDSSCFERRIESFKNRLDPVWQSEIEFDLTELMPPALAEKLGRRERSLRAFDLSVIARFLFSCLVDADFKDTEAFYAKREGWQPDREWPSLKSLLDDFLDRFDAHMAGVVAEARGDPALNAMRAEILAHVRAKAAMPPGLFTLTVPTGGGKTLASLAFALEHAKAHGLRRIIYGIPFTSIVDQTADIFAEVLGEEHILEHHSAVEEDEKKAGDRTKDRLPTSRDRLRLAMEDWAAPVIVTTNVQLFESLFAARTSRARKLHNIAGSIIILDEAQTIPRHLLRPCARMLETMAEFLGCTIVLCTATQPALHRVEPALGLKLDGNRELAPDPHDLATRLRRARIVRAGPMDNAALVEALRAERQGLVIVNSRRHALDLYKAAEGLEGRVHLSTRQYAAHRRRILEDVKERLPAGAPCRVIATSLIEAGVDVDFPRVWRAEAGWDQVLQAAGRCNREGKRARADSIVTVFHAPDYPPPAAIEGLVADTVRALKAFPDDELQSLEAIERFFEEVYWHMGDRLDGGGERTPILPRLKMTAGTGANFAFRSIAADFRMIDSEMQPVIIPIEDKAKEAVDKLDCEKIPSGALARKLQTYMVLVPPKARALLIQNGHAAYRAPEIRGGQFLVLEKLSMYRRDVGLLWEEAIDLAPEDKIV